MSDFEEARKALDEMKSLKPTLSDTEMMCRGNPKESARMMMLMADKLEQALEKCIQCAQVINDQHEQIGRLAEANSQLEAANASLRSKLV